MVGAIEGKKREWPRSQSQRLLTYARSKRQASVRQSGRESESGMGLQKARGRDEPVRNLQPAKWHEGVLGVIEASGWRAGELGSCCSGTKILCMHNLSRIYGWQYCEKEDFPQHSWLVCVMVVERGEGIAWALKRPVRRLCVREIKLPNGHYLGAQGLRKLLRLWKLLNYVNAAPSLPFPFCFGWVWILKDFSAFQVATLMHILPPSNPEPSHHHYARCPRNWLRNCQPGQSVHVSSLKAALTEKFNTIVT